MIHTSQQQKLDQRFLCMQAVAGFLPHYGAWVVKQRMADFFTTVSRQAVQEQHIGLGAVEQRFAHLETGKVGFTLGLFLLLAHRGPYIGGDQVSLGNRLGGVVQQSDTITRRSQQVSIRLVALRAAHSQLEVELTCSVDPRVAHIIAVANPYRSASPYAAT